MTADQSPGEQEKELSQNDINLMMAKQFQKLTEEINHLKITNIRKVENNDPSDNPLTVRSVKEIIIENLPLIKSILKPEQPPTDPNNPMYLALGKQMFKDTFEEISKRVFDKSIGKEQAQNYKNSMGIQ